MHSPFIELTYNLAVLAAMISMSGFVMQRWRDKGWEAILQGLLFGIAALIGMMRPLTLAPGLIFDGRSVVISLCALFFGPWAVAIAGGGAVLYRVTLGGPGVYTGVWVITASALLGLVFHYRWRRAGEPLTAGRLFGLGVLVHAAMVLLMFTLPGGKGLATVKNLGLPIMAVYPLATLIIGRLLASQEAGIMAGEMLRLTRISVESASDALFWMTPDARIVDVNAAACRSLGFGREELLAMVVPDIDPCYAAEVWQQHFSELRKQGTLRFESQHRTKDGRVFPVEIVANYVQDRTGEYNCAIVRDISERKQAERDRAEMELRLRQSQKMEAIGTLAGGIAHDFNNMLSAILGYTELAIEEEDSAKRLQDLERVKIGALRATELVKQILSFSRKTDQEKQPLPMARVVKEAMKMLRSSIPATIEINEDISASGTVLADPAQIHQIVMNLCTNAYQAMRESGGTLTVTLGNVELRAGSDGIAGLKPGRYVKLTVSDTGCGINREFQEKIFEPYFTTKQPGEGTGLGLAVTHGILKSLDGHITVDSEPGKGTTFCVYLPISDEVAVEQAREADNVGLLGNGERILFVDDEAPICEFATLLFSRHGYQVTTCANGAEGLQQIRRDPALFDLVVTDMTMPHMTGAEFARQVLAIRPEMPIIICTGQSDLIDREKALAMGICDYLAKPVGKNDFLSAIRKALAARHPHPGPPVAGA